MKVKVVCSTATTLALFMNMNFFNRSAAAAAKKKSTRRQLRSRDLTAIYSTLPAESSPHEGTWLQWPHPYTYGSKYCNDIEPTWVAMTSALVESEEVYIIAYNDQIQVRAKDLLAKAGVSLDNVSFLLAETDDVWVRDDGPFFVQNEGGNVDILNFDFNGWGYDAPYKKDYKIPIAVADDLDMELIDLTDVTLEGGAIEVDGRGTLLATRSAVLRNGRNPDMTESEMNDVMLEFFGVSNVIWLDGKNGGKDDITDFHIDGFARFGDPHTIVTMIRNDLLEWGISDKDIATLLDAKDVDGTPYDFVYLPLTVNNVKTTAGENLGFRGSYANFYTGNTVVLIPSYNDPNDSVARQKLQELYPDRKVVSVDVRNLIKEGGMIHCVTKEQMMSPSSS